MAAERLRNLAATAVVTVFVGGLIVGTTWDFWDYRIEPVIRWFSADTRDTPERKPDREEVIGKWNVTTWHRNDEAYVLAVSRVEIDRKPYVLTSWCNESVTTFVAMNEATEKVRDRREGYEAVAIWREIVAGNSAASGSREVAERLGQACGWTL